MNLQKILLYLTLSAAVANVLANLWLIPKYSGLGAAIATVVSYGLVGNIFQGALRDTRPIMLDYLGATIKPMIASIIMGIVICNFLALHVVAVISIGMVTYAAAMLLIKGVDLVDVDHARQILYRQRNARVIE